MMSSFGHGDCFHSLFFSSRLKVSMWSSLNFYLLHIYRFPFDTSKVGEAMMGAVVNKFFIASTFMCSAPVAIFNH